MAHLGHVALLLSALVVGCKEGPTGPQGPVGARGVPGPQGDAGAPAAAPVITPVSPGAVCLYGGVMVTIGSESAPVCNGAPGPQGDPGTPGSAGLQGVQGLQGLKGDKGDKGDTGPKGDQGLTGMKGDPGTPGAKGDAGAAGLGLDKAIMYSPPPVTVTIPPGGQNIATAYCTGTKDVAVTGGCTIDPFAALYDVGGFNQSGSLSGWGCGGRLSGPQSGITVTASVVCVAVP